MIGKVKEKVVERRSPKGSGFSHNKGVHVDLRCRPPAFFKGKWRFRSTFRRLRRACECYNVCAGGNFRRLRRASARGAPTAVPQYLLHVGVSNGRKVRPLGCLRPTAGSCRVPPCRNGSLVSLTGRGTRKLQSNRQGGRGQATEWRTRPFARGICNAPRTLRAADLSRSTRRWQQGSKRWLQRIGCTASQL